MDSGAGQCMTSCSEAFTTLNACAVLIVGVGGSMPAHGVGTACFMATIRDVSYVFLIHNCLLCHGEDGYNLLSVSQILRAPLNGVVFRSGSSNLEIQGQGKGGIITFDLNEHDGLYEMKLFPLYPDDGRLKTLVPIHVTLENDSQLWGQASEIPLSAERKSPTKLGRWHSKMLWISRKMAPMQGIQEYNDDLNQFCESYLAPPSKTSARRTYKVTDVDDMSELSVRFMGLGTDRLMHTLDRSRGLTAATKTKGENISVVPPHNFPQGKWKSGK